jgi:hypothetical protein
MWVADSNHVLDDPMLVDRVPGDHANSEITPDPLARRWQLQELLDIVTRAVDLQDAANVIVAECGRPGRVPTKVAHDGSLVFCGYWRLRRDLAGLPIGADLGGLRDDLSKLIACHQMLVHGSIALAFQPLPTPRSENARLRLTGLGAPGARLRELRDLIATLTRTAA